MVCVTCDNKEIIPKDKCNILVRYIYHLLLCDLRTWQTKIYLKRCLENIISTLNIYHLTKSDNKEDIVDMKIKDFKLPITLTKIILNLY